MPASGAPACQANGCQPLRDTIGAGQRIRAPAGPSQNGKALYLKRVGQGILAAWSSLSLMRF